MKSLDGRIKNLLEAKVKGYLKNVFSAGPRTVRIKSGLDGIEVECSGVLNKYERNLVDLFHMERSVVQLRQEVFQSTRQKLERDISAIIEADINQSKLKMDTKTNRCNILLKY